VEIVLQITALVCSHHRACSEIRACSGSPTVLGGINAASWLFHQEKATSYEVRDST